MSHFEPDNPVCDFQHGLPPLDEDEYVLETPSLRAFVSGVRTRIEEADSPGRACALIEPLFSRLLTDRAWLPERYQEPAAESGMGGGIGQWLLFSAADRSLALFSLVVPPGAMTPVHDHLAWGLGVSQHAAGVVGEQVNRDRSDRRGRADAVHVVLRATRRRERRIRSARAM